MTRFVELHTLHHVPPSLLNRDDTGAHKRQMLGGVSRLSLSPQSQKRACRTRFEEQLDIGQRGLRTGILPGQVRDDLVVAGWDEAEATTAVKAVFGLVGIGTNGETTPNLLFVPALARDEIVALCQRYRAELSKTKPAKNVADAVKSGMANAFNPGRTVAIALAGRMVADPKWDMEPVEAALSISHAIGTNAAKAGSELDYFTAVDDAKQAAEIAGAGHIGMKEYGSTVFYRFSVVDVDRLTSNLDGDGDVAELALATHLSTMPVTLPGGAQTNAAAFTRPALVMVVVRDGQPLSLADAFVKPVTPTSQEDLIARSIAALDAHVGGLETMFGKDGLIARAVAVYPAYAEQLKHLADTRVATLEEVIAIGSSAFVSSPKREGVEAA